ncbi:Bacterial regulatory protein, tetR family [Actinomadura rubteroloni]|uniref:Bacterial regulatory protein, tetR family n=2 Tax=Actinomadura rubteroloni TaxID=1926885 RepID=A0A2P4UIM3_9ACTN|nr:Bacterial regulatory protein, tetR family [Actinomadura rubteroloni]
MPNMGRWVPDARGRLERAALELYAEHGYERTTVAEIAARAGLTERTFFRHFADKREVLFGGAEPLRDLIVRTAAEAPASAAPITVAAAAVEAVGVVLGERRTAARQRQAVIDAHPELRERELIKLAALGDALAGALRDRGVPDLAAALAAEAGLAAFKVAADRWIHGPDGEPLAAGIREAFAELKTITAG